MKLVIGRQPPLLPREPPMRASRPACVTEQELQRPHASDQVRSGAFARWFWHGDGVELEAADHPKPYRSWSHDETYRQVFAGQPSGLSISVPTLVDSSLAPVGEHIVTATTLIPYDLGASWRTEKARYADRLLEELEAVFPGVRAHITFAEGASPRTMERYTLNLTGAIYGWEVSPKQVGRRRLPHVTPIRGLYLSGHWTQPGGGVYGVVASGLETARVVVGDEVIADFLGALPSA